MQYPDLRQAGPTFSLGTGQGCLADRAEAGVGGASSLELRGNRLLLWGVAVELLLLLAIVYTPWGQRLFGTAPLSWPVWLLALPFPFVMVAAEETRKALMRRWRHG